MKFGVEMEISIFVFPNLTPKWVFLTFRAMNKLFNLESTQKPPLALNAAFANLTLYFFRTVALLRYSKNTSSEPQNPSASNSNEVFG